MRWMVPAAVVLACLAAGGVAHAQQRNPDRQDDPDFDLQWAMQDRARGLVGLRGVVAASSSFHERAAGGELTLGGWLAGSLAMELRVGHAWWLARDNGGRTRDLWYGLGLRGRIGHDWTVSPILGAGLFWHELTDDRDGLEARGEVGLGVFVSRDAVIVLGVTGSTPVIRHAAGVRLESFLGLDVHI